MTFFQFFFHISIPKVPQNCAICCAKPLHCANTYWKVYKENVMNARNVSKGVSLSINSPDIWLKLLFSEENYDYQVQFCHFSSWCVFQLSYVWGIVLQVHVNFSLMIHTVSIWLTLSLAIWRYIMIKYHSLAQASGILLVESTFKKRQKVHHTIKVLV